MRRVKDFAQKIIEFMQDKINRLRKMKRKNKWKLAGTVYTATIVLTANEGYCFSSDTTVTVSGAASTAKEMSSDGKTLTVTASFAATAEDSTEETASTEGNSDTTESGNTDGTTATGSESGTGTAGGSGTGSSSSTSGTTEDGNSSSEDKAEKNSNGTTGNNNSNTAGEGGQSGGGYSGGSGHAVRRQGRIRRRKRNAGR